MGSVEWDVVASSQNDCKSTMEHSVLLAALIFYGLFAGTEMYSFTS